MRLLGLAFALLAVLAAGFALGVLASGWVDPQDDWPLPREDRDRGIPEGI